MATVAYRAPSVVLPFLAGVGGAAAGAVEGEKQNEQKRQFDANLQEQGREANADLTFRVEQLKVMQKEGRLTRDQEQRLALLEQQGQNLRQGKQIASTEGINTQNVNSEEKQTTQRVASEEKQTVQKLQQSNVENKRTVAAENYATKTRDDADKRGFQLAGDQLYGAKERLDSVGRIKATYGDPKTWSTDPATYTKAFQQYLREVHPGGTTTGQDAIPQLPQAQVLQDEKTFQHLLLNYDQEKGRLEKDQATFFQNQSLANSAASPQAAAALTQKDPGLKLADVLSDAPVDPHWGQAPLNYQNPVLGKWSGELEAINGYLLDVSSHTAGQTWNRGQLETDVDAEVWKRLGPIDVSTETKQTLHDYFMTNFSISLNPEITPLNLPAAVGGASGGGNVEVGGN